MTPNCWGERHATALTGGARPSFRAGDHTRRISEFIAYPDLPRSPLMDAEAISVRQIGHEIRFGYTSHYRALVFAQGISSAGWATFLLGTSASYELRCGSGRRYINRGSGWRTCNLEAIRILVNGTEKEGIVSIGRWQSQTNSSSGSQIFCMNPQPLVVTPLLCGLGRK
jgi:hypothetical protein